jgi:hypothetical protein
MPWRKVPDSGRSTEKDAPGRFTFAATGGGTPLLWHGRETNVLITSRKWLGWQGFRDVARAVRLELAPAADPLFSETVAATVTA